jgi:hypothetical protein
MMVMVERRGRGKRRDRADMAAPLWRVAERIAETVAYHAVKPRGVLAGTAPKSWTFE